MWRSRTDRTKKARLSMKRIFEHFRSAESRTLLEMWTGMLLTGILCQIVGGIVVYIRNADQLRYAESLWFGVLLGIAGSVHMYRTLDRALDYDEKNAAKKLTAGYMFRYTVLCLFLSVIMITDVLNPLIVFMGYMTLKVAAYLQPFTHKLYNMLYEKKIQ